MAFKSADPAKANEVYMSAEEVRGIMEEIYGPGYGATRLMAKETGNTEATVSRWRNGQTVIPRATAAHIRLLLKYHRALDKLRKPQIIEDLL